MVVAVAGLGGEVLVGGVLSPLVDVAALVATVKLVGLIDNQPVGLVVLAGNTGASDVADGVAGADDGGVGLGAADEDLEGSKIENVLALHLAQKLSTLQTSGLVQVSGGGTGGGTGTLLDLDLVVAT